MSPTESIYIDFLSGKMTYRRQHASLRKELLARAMGLKNKTQPKIIDATAGLGRDSFILACLGFEVTLLERSPVVYTALHDAIQRALNDSVVSPIVQRLHLIQIDALTWMKNCKASDRPTIIYLDPMFPERTKSALVKKDMRIFHDIVGEDPDADDLLSAALACTTQRVVVKRPRLAPSLMNLSPSFSMKGSSSRFDVYLKGHNGTHT